MSFESTILIVQLIILFFSVVVHEISHGYVAKYLGDDTAEKMGRLTLNPLKHLDPFGSIILPLLFIITKAPFVLGWAKPVPFNPYNLRNPKTGGGIIAAAGPIVNFILAIIFGLLIRFLWPLGVSPFLILSFAIVVFLNLALGIFNLLPIPPLDGSKILFALLPDKYFELQRFLETYGFFIILLLLFLGILTLIFLAASWLFTLLVGQPLGLFLMPFGG